MKHIKLRSAIINSLLTVLFAVAFSFSGFAQTPTNQDCLNAIPLCGDTVTNTNNYVGIGNYNNVNAIHTCNPQHGEINSVWYIFTTQSTGPVEFTLTPLSAGADYDWELYDITTTTCAQIFTGTGMIACNHWVETGVPTGIGCNHTDSNFVQNPNIPTVLSGHTLVLCIDNMLGVNGGFHLDFSCSTAQILDNVPPHMSSINAPVACNATSIKVNFSENITCITNPNCFYIEDANNFIYTMDSITSPNCDSGAAYSSSFTMHFHPALPHSGQYILYDTCGTFDLCNNQAASAHLPFNIGGVNAIPHVAPAGCTCQGRDSLHVTGQAPFTYAWSSSSTTSSNLTSATITDLCAGGIWTCTVHGNTGCPAVIIDTIPSGSNFIITDTSINSSCSSFTGQAWVNTITNGTGPYSYLWSPGNSTDSLETNLPPGHYSVTVTDQTTGCTDTASTTIGAGGNLSATAFSTNSSCGNATNGTAWVTVIGNSVYTFLWSNSNDSANIHNLAAATYTVTVTDTATGCTVSATTTVSSGGSLTLTMSAGTVPCANAIDGQAWVATISGGTSPYHYIWSPSAATTRTATGLHSGNYDVTVTDANGCTAVDSVNIAIADTMTLTFSAQPPTCAFPNQDQIFVTPNGAGPTYHYHWTNGNNTSLIQNVAANTVFTVTVTDVNSGCTVTDTISLQLQNTMSLTMHSTNILCHGGSTGTASETIFNGSGPYHYAWSPSTATTATASNLISGNYIVTVTETAHASCFVIDSVTITDPPALTISDTSYTSSCGQGNGSAVAHVTGGTGPDTYLWSPSAQTTDSATHLVAGTYYVTVTDSNHCTITDSVTIGMVGGPTASITASTNVLCHGGNSGTATASANGGTTPYSYSWNSNPIQTTAIATNLPIGLFTVVVSDATGCTSVDSVTITQPPAMTIVVGGATTECIGQSAIITAHAAGGIGGYTYTWSNANTNSVQTINPLVTTTYFCTATDANGCVSPVDSITVTVLPGIICTAFGPSDTICSGTKVNLSATASGGNNGPYTYTWTPGPVVGNPVSVYPSVTTTYTCSANDGCSAIPGITVIIVNVDPVPLVNIGKSVEVGCDPLTVTFSDLSLDVPSGSRYLWSFGGLGFDTAENPTFTMIGSGLYNIRLTVTTPEGCTASMIDSDAIQILPKPIAIINAVPLVTTLSNAYITFYNYSVGGDLWDWMFADARNSTSSMKNPSFLYLDTGVFRAELIVINNYGCTDTGYVNIVIKDDYTLFVPNAFTPDLPYNNVFGPSGINVSDYVMYIFDRWGNQIFSTTDLSNTWNGTDSNGSKVSENVYIYLIKTSDNDGNKHSYNGTVTVIR